MIELTIRLVASLAVVVGLLLVMMRLGARRFRPRAGAPLRIVHRQALSRTSSLAVVEVGSRILVLGTTEHQINVLAELDEDELAGPVEQDGVIDMAAVRAAGLALSVESPSRRAVAEATPIARTPAPPRRRPGAHAAKPAPSAPLIGGSLAGSVLSPQTWRQALAVATGRA